MNKALNLFLITTLLMISFSCYNTPPNADFIGVLRVDTNRICLYLVDSYYNIDKYKTYIVDDTLFIKIKSIAHIQREEAIQISISDSQHFVKIQDDKLLLIDSIKYKKSK